MGHGMYHGPRLPASPPMRTAFGGIKQTLGNIICTGVMPSPPRIIPSGSIENNTSGIVLSNTEIKIETIVVFKLLYFRLRLKIREFNGEHGWGCEPVRLVRVTCMYIVHTVHIILVRSNASLPIVLTCLRP